MASKRTVQEYLRFVQKEKFSEHQRRLRARQDAVDLMVHVVHELLGLVMEQTCENLEIPIQVQPDKEVEIIEIGADDILDAIDSSLGFTASTPFSLLDCIPSQPQPTDGTEFGFTPSLLEPSGPNQTPTPRADVTK